MASRILGMGDVVGLMQDFEQVVDKKKAEEDADAHASAATSRSTTSSSRSG